MLAENVNHFYENAVWEIYSWYSWKLGDDPTMINNREIREINWWENVSVANADIYRGTYPD